MKFSPIHIKNQQFTSSFRGFDKDEVKLYLEKLADEYEQLSRENEQLKKENEKLLSRISEYKKIEKNLQDTLLKAQESSTKAVESSKKQAALVVKEAELKAAQILEKARLNADEIRSAVVRLREEKNLIVAKLKAFVQSQSQLLEFNNEDKSKDYNAGLRAVEQKTPAASNTAAKTDSKDDINTDDILEKLI